MASTGADQAPDQPRDPSPAPPSDRPAGRPAPRPAIGALTGYRPGRSASQANRDHGLTDAIKLAGNENPYPPVPAVAEAVAKEIESANLYRDHRAAALRAAIADQVGTDADRVTVGAGSIAIIYQLAVAYLDPGDEVLTPWISFEAFPVIAQTMGAVLVEVPIVDHAYDLDAVADAVGERTRMITLANPNNPTGTAVSTDEIRKLLDRVPDDVVVLVDEAYREFMDPALGDPADPADGLLADHANVIVTRTFSKAYSLAGVRVGYAMADPEIIAAVDQCLIPFNVNGPAQAAALAALEARDQIRPRLAALTAERERVTAELRGRGWAVPDSQANFVFLPAGDRTDDICVGLERRGVVTRPFTGWGLRVTVSLPAHNDRFLAALDEAAPEPVS